MSKPSKMFVFGVITGVVVYHFWAMSRGADTAPKRG